jgi:polyisoprenoid-binding protein YceI
MNTRLLALSGIAAVAFAAAGTMMAIGGREPQTISGLGQGLSKGLAATPAAAPADAKTFTVDPVHSNVIFRIKHLNASNFYGRFNETTGSFTLGDTAAADITVKAGSVDTHNSKRDDHVKSPDFFSAKEFPDITFSATSLKKAGEGVWRGSGDLTLHGVKKTIDVDIHQNGGGPGMGGKGEVAGIECSFHINRTDYGIKTMVGPLSDDVMLIVSLEGGTK